ncbi:MAG: iron ABC transporter permease [Acidobacteriota bacterium]
MTALGALVLVLLACLLLAASLGAGRVPVLDLLRGRALDSAGAAILWQVRLPRVLLAAVLGGGLAVAGVVFQALLRNPLADPYVLGVSGGASLGGVAALLVGLGRAPGLMGEIGVAGFAFLGALGALVVIERVATVDGHLAVYTLLLSGAIFNAFSGAVIFFVQSIASLEQLHAMVFYLMGQVPSLGFAHVGAVAAVVMVVCAVLWRMARDFNVASLGEESAAQLGVDTERLKRKAFVLGSLLTAIAVSVAGLIGFVGLVVPHALRLILGPDHRVLVPVAFLGGASFLVLADLMARTVAAPSELPVGVITALIGGPFFLYLLRARGGAVNRG